MLRISSAVSAVVEVTSVQPTSEKRTWRQLGGSAGAGLYDFASSLGAPLRLADLGVEREQLDAIAELAIAQPYWTPRPLERDAVRTLLEHAWAGERPA